MARLILDEDVSHAVADELRRLGHDVVVPADVGRARQRIPDDQVLSFATDLDRAVVTRNQWHFVKLHRTTAVHAGIVVCTYDPDAVALAARIDRAVRDLPALAGRLVRVNRPSQ